MSSTRVRVPHPPPSPLPASLSNDIIGALFSHTDAIPSLQQTLLSETEKAGWLDAVRKRSLQLLREDEGRSQRDVMKILVKEARAEETSGLNESGLNTSSKTGEQEAVDVRIPQKAVKEGTRVVRDALADVVAFEERSR